ncbi:MAG: MFS transporter [Bacteroidetes bacterium]|nr:MAG: MFS transporter [Bacteroidota bacterium]
MEKPRLSFWQIWNMSFGFLGIQFGFALQNANVSRIFETLGADVESIPILWVAAPVTGLLIQPIIGHMSDKTWHPRWGRRRPFFMIGAILASLALFIMPNSPLLWVAAGMLWIMDASINVSMEPFRAFVGDLLPGEQRTAGFAMQSFFIGTGAVIASALPYILSEVFGVKSEAAEGVVPDQVKYSFYIGGAVFLLAVMWTVFTTKEYSPEEVAAFSESEKADAGPAAPVAGESTVAPNRFRNVGLGFLLTGILTTLLVNQMSLGKKELYILTVGLAAFGVISLVAGMFSRQTKTEGGFMEVMQDLYTMPKTMAQLAIVQFFSWFALFAMWIYTTAAITSSIYGTTDASSAAYNEGADWVGVCFAVYNGVAALVAFLLPPLARATSRKTVHLICLLLGGLGLASIFFVSDPNMLLLSMVGVGIGWASILSMPYAILSGALPSQKMGVYMGIFNFFIVIPQLVAASILGFLVGQLFEGHAVYALLIGGVSMALAGLLTLLVDDVDERRQRAAAAGTDPNLTNYFNRRRK